MKRRISKASAASVLLSGAAICALSGGAALAQADQIVVTATKRPQTLQEVPVAVSVVDAEVIEDAQIQDLIDLQSSVSSLRVTQQQNASQTNFIIRGFGNGANNPGIEASVGVFVDGVFRSRSASAILDLPTLERVEVLRGPQSTLFGKNVSVGAISLTTKAPSYDWEGSVEATAGNLGAVRFRGTLSGPISDTLAFRISGSSNERDGTYTNLADGSDNINERDRWAVRGQLLWEPTENLSFRAIGDYNKIDEVCCGAVQLDNSGSGAIFAPPPFGLGATIAPAGDPDARLVAVNTEPTNELEGKGGSLQGDWDLGFGVLTSITSYREQEDRNQTDIDFTTADIGQQPQSLKLETFTQEVRLAGSTDTGVGRFNWLAGGFLFSEDVSFFQQTLFNSEFRAFGDALLGGLAGIDFLTVEGSSQLAQGLTTGPAALFPEFMPTGGATALAFGSSFAEGTGFTGDYTLDNRSYSLFFQTDWEITDRLTLTGGVSYVNDRKIGVGDIVLTEPFENFDLSQFQTSGGSFVAASIFGGLIGTPFDPANPTPFFTAAATLAATDPATFAATRAGAVAAAQGALAGDPTLNPLLGLTGLTALQFIPPQTPFPQAGDARDKGITLSDDGFSADDDVNFTARLAYDVTDNLNAYFSYSTGFKASAINLSQDALPPFLGPNGQVGGRFAGPESVKLYEIGFKANFDKGYINIALFDQTVEGFQSNTFVGTGFVLANAGEQSVRGFEIDASYSPIEPLNLFMGLTYLDPEYDVFTGAPCPSAGVASIIKPEIVAACADPAVNSFDASGERPSGIHPVSITSAATYTHQFAHGATLTGRVEYLFESETKLFDFGSDLAPVRKVSTVNANLQYELENGFSVNVWGRNLNDDDALITSFPTVAQTGSFSGYVVAPRTYGVSLRKTF